MKFLIIISIISLMVFSLNAQFPDLCVWQKSKDAVVAKLTPQGQGIVGQLMKDLQFAVGAGVQPIYQQVKAQYPSLVTQVNF